MRRGTTIKSFMLAGCFAAMVISGTHSLTAQDLGLSPTRPTIANSVTIQQKDVLQVEIGYDAYPQQIPQNQQTASLSLYYTPLERLRLDFGWSPFSHQAPANGVGTIQAGGKVVLLKENFHAVAPGVGLQYEAEFPTASQTSLQGFGQQIILLMNHHYGKDGKVDVMVNGSLVQSDCQTKSGCSYGGQQSLALSYHVGESTRLYAEVFGQNNSQSNTPPGTYVFGGFYRKVTETFGIDGGVRFGVTDHSASVGTTVGIVLGRRMRHESNPAHNP